jgi:DNA-binding NarL/FixJ family response regulator
VLLADDHAIIREGLRSLLEKQPDMEVLADTDEGRKAVELTRELLPDVVIMDVTMAGLNGIEATRLITSEFPEVRVIALSIHSQRRFIADMLSAGAAGYILKECLFDELVQAIRAVAVGGRYLSPRIADVVVEDYVNRLSTTVDSPLSDLTGREREVLQLDHRGQSTSNHGETGRPQRCRAYQMCRPRGFDRTRAVTPGSLRRRLFTRGAGIGGSPIFLPV